MDLTKHLYKNFNIQRVTFKTFSKVLAAFLAGFYGIKVTKWLLSYIRTAWIMNKIPGIPMIPFIGNATLFLGKDPCM